MVVTGQVHIPNWGVGISTPEVGEKKATVQIKTRVKNETALPKTVMVQTNIFIQG
jgi:beta-galactosidase